MNTSRPITRAAVSKTSRSSGRLVASSSQNLTARLPLARRASTTWAVRSSPSPLPRTPRRSASRAVARAGRDPQDAFGCPVVVIGGQVGLAARRGPGVEGLSHRLTAADMPDVRDQDAPAVALAPLAPPGDHFFALVGGHDRRLSRLGQQPDGQNRPRPPSRHRRPAASRGASSLGSPVAARAAATALSCVWVPAWPLHAATQQTGHGHHQRGRQQQRRPAVTSVTPVMAGPVITSLGGLPGRSG